jgi:hypothetical protein
MQRITILKYAFGEHITFWMKLRSSENEGKERNQLAAGQRVSE